MKKKLMIIPALLCGMLLTGCTDNSAQMYDHQTIDFVSEELLDDTFSSMAKNCFGNFSSYTKNWEGRPEMDKEYEVVLKHLWKTKTMYITLVDSVPPSVSLVNPYASKDGMTGIEIEDQYWAPEDCTVEISGIDLDVPGDYYADVVVKDGSGNKVEFNDVTIKVVDKLDGAFPITVTETGTPFAGADETSMPGDFVPAEGETSPEGAEAVDELVDEIAEVTEEAAEDVSAGEGN